MAGLRVNGRGVDYRILNSVSTEYSDNWPWFIVSKWKGDGWDGVGCIVVPAYADAGLISLYASYTYLCTYIYIYIYININININYQW